MSQKKWLSALIVFTSFGICETRLAYSSDTLPELGNSLSKLHCARCHVVDSENPFSGISSTPSFPLLVNNFNDWEERFLSFHTRLPHPSIVRFNNEPIDPNTTFTTVPMVLEYTDIDAIVAYAKTLKKN